MSYAIRNLRTRLRVQRSFLMSNEAGALQTVWEDYKEVWGYLFSRGEARFRTKALPSHFEGVEGMKAMPYRIVLRYEPSLNASMRFVEKECIYYCDGSPTHDPFKRWTTIEAFYREEGQTI